MTRLRSNQADKCLVLQECPTSVRPTSARAYMSDQQMSGQQVTKPTSTQDDRHQANTNISISSALGIGTLHLTKEQIPMNGACITWQRRDYTSSLWHGAEQQPHARETARLPSDTVQNSHHISEG